MLRCIPLVMMLAAPLVAQPQETRAETLYQQAIFCHDDARGDEPQLQLAMNLYQQAADLGHISALFELAQLQMLGIGGIVEASQARENMWRAARAGHAPAQVFVASLSLTGQWGAVRDEALAYHYYTQAAKQGDADALFMLAHCHAHGI